MPNISILLTLKTTTRFVFFIPLVFILSACIASTTQVGTTPKAVFIIVDGIPADVIEKTHTPFIDDLAKNGGYTRSYVGGEIGAITQSPTVSAVGYNSLLTGTWANKHNVYDNSIDDPNYQYWDIFRITKNANPALNTALFSTWQDNRTRLLGDGLKEAGGNKIDYYFDGFEHDLKRFPHDDSREYIKNIDLLVSQESARYLVEQGPDLSWVYLEFTDDVGHMFGDGQELREAVNLMDKNIGEIWEAIKNRERQKNEDWLVLVTTDHGRDATTGKSHGGQSDRERTTWIATNSLNLNHNFYNAPAIVDILPSIINHLGLIVPSEISDQFDGHTFID